MWNLTCIEKIDSNKWKIVEIHSTCNNFDKNVISRLVLWDLIHKVEKWYKNIHPPPASTCLRNGLSILREVFLNGESTTTCRALYFSWWISLACLFMLKTNSLTKHVHCYCSIIEYHTWEDFVPSKQMFEDTTTRNLIALWTFLENYYIWN